MISFAGIDFYKRKKKVKPDNPELDKNGLDKSELNAAGNHPSSPWYDQSIYKRIEDNPMFKEQAG